MIYLKNLVLKIGLQAKLMLQKADVVCKCVRGRHRGLGLGQKDTEQRKRTVHKLQEKLKWLVMLLVQIVAVQIMLILRVICAAAGVELPMLSGRSQGSELDCSRGRSTCWKCRSALLIILQYHYWARHHSPNGTATFNRPVLRNLQVVM